MHKNHLIYFEGYISTQKYFLRKYIQVIFVLVPMFKRYAYIKPELDRECEILCYQYLWLSVQSLFSVKRIKQFSFLGHRNGINTSLEYSYYQYSLCKYLTTFSWRGECRGHSLLFSRCQFTKEKSIILEIGCLKFYFFIYSFFFFLAALHSLCDRSSPEILEN